MSPRIRKTSRRTHRAGLLASLVAAAALFAGCSASGSSMEAGGVEDYADAAAPAFERSDGSFSYAEDGSSESLSPPEDRSLIITGAMYITVEDPIAAADRAATIVRGVGGRVDARDESAPDEDFGGAASLTLRIPSDALDRAVDSLRGLGTVDQFTTSSLDVTTEVTDLEAKISTLRASTERIEALLVEAEGISDIITLENELSHRQAELEGLEARQRGLNDQVSMSTIDLSLTTEPVVVLVDDSPENFLEALSAGWNSLVDFLSKVLVNLGLALPWIALFAVITLALAAVVRARRFRNARAVAPVEESSAAP